LRKGKRKGGRKGRVLGKPFLGEKEIGRRFREVVCFEDPGQSGGRNETLKKEKRAC